MPRAAMISVALIAAAAFGQNVPDAAAIGKIRENARNYMERLGLLTCTENTRQTVRIADVTSSERREDGCDTTGYKLFAVQAIGLTGPGVDVKHASADWRERLREASLGTATGFLASLADPAIDADFRWVRMVTVSGRTVAVISFRVSASNGYVLADTARTTRVPYTGLICSDPATGAFVRIEIRCVDIPRDSEYEGADVAVDFSSFRVNGRMVDLPSHSVVRFQMKRGDAVNEADYSGYRLPNFGADSQIRFDR